MRVITDDTFNRLIVMLSKDEKVKLFNELITSKKIEEVEAKAEEKDNGISENNTQSA